MFYFVPAWYSKENNWQDDTPLWFRVFEKMTFDDTVNQLKMFQSIGEASRLLILNYQPNLRYFLHKQDLLGVSYWSFFDDIQNIKSVDTNPIDFKALNWPDQTEFLYSPFAVVAKCSGRVLAHICFAENGNLYAIDFLKENQVDKRYIFDDRGFLSSILYYKNGQEEHRDYLNENGIWQVREHLSQNGLIEVNTLSDLEFEHRTYQNWEQMMQERLSVFKVEYLKQNDSLVIASHNQHNQLLCTQFVQQNKIFSFFSHRPLKDQIRDLADIYDVAKFIVTDTENMDKTIKEAINQKQLTEKPITRISPFDTRLRLGHSQNVKDLEIYFLVDGLDDDEFLKAVVPILSVMEDNPLIVLKIATIDSHRQLGELERELNFLLDTKFDKEKFMRPKDDDSENKVDENELVLGRIKLKLYTNENQIIKALDTSRLVIDLGRQPDLYTQIASISAGIPQINLVKTDYLSHKENGWLITNYSDLPKAISYYFDGLANWNKALISSIEKMTDYTSGRILEQWKSLLER